MPFTGLFFFYVKIFVIVYVLQGNQYLWDEELGTEIVAENGRSVTTLAHDL